MAKNNLKEELNRFKTLLGYDPSLGNITESKRREAPGYRDYMGETLNEAEPEEEDTTEEPSEDENTEGGDFDFGEAGSPEGEEDTTEEPATEEMPNAEEEPQEDEFGTADEFSASDELGGDEDVEEIDVTAIVDKSEEAKNLAQKAVTVGEKNTEFLQTLTDKLNNLETSLSKMDTIASKLSKLEQDIKTPEEKLELRSLDSYPFNMKLTDYWEEKANSNPHYKVSSGKENMEKEYVINPEDIDDYNESDIQSSFKS